ncbi:hypothetical protein KCP74_13910 [Salmonella enterica subsp. enterica]|nr:hypothetical protein KCP74_13910 [Salmonella enterica subsp. enterica]
MAGKGVSRQSRLKLSTPKPGLSSTDLWMRPFTGTGSSRESGQIADAGGAVRAGHQELAERGISESNNCMVRIVSDEPWHHRSCSRDLASA